MKTYNDTMYSETKDMATVTYNGWDGKSYNGEPCRRRIYTDRNGNKYVRAMNRGWRCYHALTGKTHPVSGAEIVECMDVYEPIHY